MSAVLEAIAVPADRRVAAHPEPAPASGHFPAVSYEIVGPDSAPVVAVLGGISSTRHVTSSSRDRARGWWESFVGPDKPLDTRRLRILSIDYLARGASADQVTTVDQARALACALDREGVEVLDAVVGASYGGMVALAFAAEYPRRLKRLITVGAAHESDPMATALRLLQRRVVELGSAAGREREAIAIARGIAVTSYVTPEHLNDRLTDADRDDSRRVVERIDAYLKSQGDNFSNGWTVDRYRALSLSLDLHRLRPENVTVPTTVIAVASDRLVPVAQSRELARRLAGPSQYIELDSPYGHDAFLHDSRIASFIGDLLLLAAEQQS